MLLSGEGGRVRTLIMCVSSSPVPEQGAGVAVSAPFPLSVWPRLDARRSLTLTPSIGESRGAVVVRFLFCSCARGRLRLTPTTWLVGVSYLAGLWLRGVSDLG